MNIKVERSMNVPERSCNAHWTFKNNVQRTLKMFYEFSMNVVWMLCECSVNVVWMLCECSVKVLWTLWQNTTATLPERKGDAPLDAPATLHSYCGNVTATFPQQKIQRRWNIQKGLPFTFRQRYANVSP